MKQIEADYLVIGTGAVGLTFVDTMLDQSDATFVMVDRHHLPGGHWNDAYSFVRLHQPSAFYGSVSMELGSNRIDETGSNKGYYELASGAEVSAYFERLMRERLLPSGRVQYFPMCNYEGNGKFSSLLSDETYTVKINKKLVDGTFYNTSVPSTHTRKFAVADGVACVTPNELPKTAAGHNHFTVLGGGKTAVDSIIWLLDHGTDPDAVTWVCPRDSWFMTRESTQPGINFFDKSAGGFASSVEALASSSTVDELFEKLEAAGTMCRVDPNITPEMFHYATVSNGEVDQLRRLTHIVRGQRVASIGAEAMVMQTGESIEAAENSLYIDCTARAVEYEDDIKTKPVFEPGLITLQPVFAPLVTYSAAAIAYVEANFETDKEKNELCDPVPLADTPAEWIPSTLGNMKNSFAWSQNKAMRSWTNSCRLNPNAAAIAQRAGQSEEHRAIIGRIRAASMMAVMNGQRLMGN